MANKAISKNYLLKSLHDFNTKILSPLFNGKVSVNQGSANVGKILKVNADGELELTTTGSTVDVITASQSYAANALTCEISIDLTDATYAVEAFSTEQHVTKNNISYNSSTHKLTVTFDNKPSVAGTVWIVATKVD